MVKRFYLTFMIIQVMPRIGTNRVNGGNQINRISYMKSDISLKLIHILIGGAFPLQTCTSNQSTVKRETYMVIRVLPLFSFMTHNFSIISVEDWKIKVASHKSAGMDQC